MRHPIEEESQSPCPHRPQCPGCSLIELPYHDQLRTKQEMLLEYLGDYKELLLPMIPAPKRKGYRNRAKLVVRSHGRFGLYGKGSHQLVEIPECPIHMHRLNDMAKIVMSEVTDRGVKVYDERTHYGFLRYIILRQSQKKGGVLLVMVTRTDKFPEGQQFARALRRKFPGLVGVIQNVNPAKGNTIEGPTNILLAGKNRLEDEINKIPFVLSSSTFLQGNHQTAGVLYKTLAQAPIWDKEDQVYDLYCGLGLTGLHIANKVKRIVGVEENETAIEDARISVRMNGKKNMAFYVGDVEKTLQLVQKRMGDPNVVIVNPPRSGCSEQVLQWINHSKADRLAYISCSPKTLARDLKILEKGGFNVESLQGFDMYPQTDQVECLAIVRRPAKPAKKS